MKMAVCAWIIGPMGRDSRPIGFGCYSARWTREPSPYPLIFALQDRVDSLRPFFGDTFVIRPFSHFPLSNIVIARAADKSAIVCQIKPI